MARKKVAEKVVKKMIAEKVAGDSVKAIANRAGLEPEKAGQLIRENWTEEDVESFEKGKLAKLAQMQSQQMTIQSREDVAERVALRFGANDIRSLQQTINEVRGTVPLEGTERIQSTINVYNVQLGEYDRKIQELEGKVKFLRGEVTDAVIQGEDQKDSQQKCGDVDARRAEPEAGRGDCLGCSSKSGGAAGQKEKREEGVNRGGQ